MAIGEGGEPGRGGGTQAPQPRRLQRLQNAHRHAQNRSRRRHRVSGDALDKATEVGRQRADGERLGDRPEPICGKIAAGPVPDDADQDAPAERYANETAWLGQRHILGDSVVQRLRQRQRQQHANPPDCSGLGSALDIPREAANRYRSRGTGMTVEHRLNSLRKWRAASADPRSRQASSAPAPRSVSGGSIMIAHSAAARFVCRSRVGAARWS